MIEIFVAGNVDDETQNAPFTTREEARLFCQLEFERNLEDDSANYGVYFMHPTEERMKKSFTDREDLDMHEFLVLKSGDEEVDGSWYWFIRTVEIYEGTDEFYRAAGN